MNALKDPKSSTYRSSLVGTHIGANSDQRYDDMTTCSNHHQTTSICPVCFSEYLLASGTSPRLLDNNLTLSSQLHSDIPWLLSFLPCLQDFMTYYYPGSPRTLPPGPTGPSQS
ncbi:hypothetical protein CC2G_004655 [Coprinopsis cinerea AmutBmut pab1-1]|nr:hypothetical protein CC2G_004655 [Coprinopsis cinerea AmutBmut pab1-1]